MRLSVSSLPYRRLSAHTAVETYPLIVGGKEVAAASGRVFPVEDPARREVVLEAADAAAGDMDQAIANGNDAFHDGVWSQSSPQHRSQVLFHLAASLRDVIPRLARLEVAQTGRPIREMNAQLGRLPEWFEYFGSLIRTEEGRVLPFAGSYLNYVQREPLGVVGQLTPWNHPLLIAVKKVAPALAAGNSVVVKPSEHAPAAVVELGRLALSAGVPEGVLNIVTGKGIETGKALASNMLLSLVDLTGGTETGKAVSRFAGEALTPTVAELGGKAPMILFEDCHVEEAVNGAAFGAFIAAGQTCIMGSRLIVHESIADRVIDKLAAKASSIHLGDPFQESTLMGPVISHEQRERIHRMVQTSTEQGCSIVTGGTMHVPHEEHLKHGHYYKPTVLRVDGSPSVDDLRLVEIVQQEVFGPVIVAYTFKDEEDAIAKANGTAFGLGASIWTRDIKRSHRVAQRVRAGIVWINDHHRNDPSSPWGAMGSGSSGWGRENGKEALKHYSQSKSVIVNTSDEPFDWFSGSNRYG